MSARPPLARRRLEVLRHPLTAGTGLVGLAGLGLAVATGAAAWALTAPLAALALAGASALLPRHPRFAAALDARTRRRDRERRRRRLEAILRRDGDRTRWDRYERLREQASELAALAERPGTQLDRGDVEAFDRATLRYLGYWEAWLAADRRLDPVQLRAVLVKRKNLDHRLGRASPRARSKLERARAELDEVLRSIEYARAHRDEVEAMMLRMERTLDDIHQRVLSRPFDRGIGDELEAVADRLQLEAALDQAVEDELEVLTARRPVSAAHRVAARGRAAGGER